MMLLRRLGFLFFGVQLRFVGCCSTDRGVPPSCCDYNQFSGVGYLNFRDCDAHYTTLLPRIWHGHSFKHNPISCHVHSSVHQLDFRIEDDFTLVVPATDSKYLVGNYCLDYIEGDVFARICDHGEIKQAPTLTWPQKYCSVVSAIILIITYAAYLANGSVEKDKQNEPYLICHSLSLAAAFICLARMKLSNVFSHGWECMVAGYLLQYFSLVAFFWMNAIYINIYMTLSQWRLQSNDKAHEILRWKEFKRFFIYAWGAPLLITLTTISLQFSDVVADPKLKPDIGLRSCFFDSLATSWIYFYGPVGMIIFFNTILFALTTAIIYKHHKATKRLRQCDKSKRDHWSMKVVILKLFVYTGSLTWGSEVVNFVVLRNVSSPESQRELVGMIDVFFHFLHAFSIFYFLVYQKGVHLSLTCFPKIKKLSAWIRPTMKTEPAEEGPPSILIIFKDT